MSVEKIPTLDVARRALLTGAGVTALAGLAAASASPAAADSDTAADPDNVVDATPVTSTIASAPMSGYTYRYASMFDFTPENSTAARAWGGYGVYGTVSTALWASFDIPAGARVRDIEWYVYNASANNVTAMARVWKAGTGTLGEMIADVVTTPGTGTRVFRTVVPSSRYGPFPPGCRAMLGIYSSNSTVQVNGVRVGFSHGGGAAGVLAEPVRVYDSRSTGGKLAAGTTRTVTLPSAHVPVGTAAVLANVIAIDPEGDGYLRAWPGNISSVTSSAVSYVNGKNNANAQPLGVSASRQVRLRSSRRVHVAIDIIGTIG